MKGSAIYLIIINALAFILMTIDFFMVKNGRKTGLPSLVYLILLVAGGSLGSLLAYLIWDRNSMKYQDKEVRDKMLNWRIPTVLMVIIHTMIFLIVCGAFKIDFRECMFNTREIFQAAGLPILIIIILFNLIAFALFGIDKKLAIKNKRRIPISVLFIVSAIGGTIGAILGMLVFHHKTSKMYFILGIPLIFIIHIMLYLMVMSTFNFR